jgi:hypothetical protein
MRARMEVGRGTEHSIAVRLKSSWNAAAIGNPRLDCSKVSIPKEIARVPSIAIVSLFSGKKRAITSHRCSIENIWQMGWYRAVYRGR